MLSRGLNLALRLSQRRIVAQIAAKNSTSAATETSNDRDPAPYFFNEEIQKLLQVITRPVPDKVFRRRLDGRRLESPTYKFMTDEQLQKAMRKAEEEMWELLQMPPIVKVRKEDARILSEDPALQGYTQSKHIYTDITFGVSNKDRIIAVREPNGTLRMATHEERDRINQIYFPIPGREVYLPKMFEDVHLQDVLARGEYEFILNRACIQFDPDNPYYHRVTEATYDCVDENMHHDKLRSTRHYGPMVFYLAWNKKIDNVLLENINTKRIEDAAMVIRLYYKLNPSETAKEETDHIKLIKHYIETETGGKRKIDHALRTYLELEAERKKVQADIEKAHGKTKNTDEKIKI